MIPVEKISTLFIGYTGENMAEKFSFDFSNWVKSYGQGEILLALKRPNDTVPYPVNLEVKDNVATWTVTSTDVAFEGSGIAEIVYKVGEIVKKSAKFKLYIENSLADATGVPESGDTWLDLMTKKVLEGQGFATDSKKSAVESENFATLSKEYADKAEQNAGQSGYMFFELKDGHLIMQRTQNTQVGFSLKEGRLILNG